MHVFNYYFLVRVASVTVKINEVLSCTKWHAWNMKYKKRVQVLACQPISTHNCAVKKIKNKTPSRDQERLSCSNTWKRLNLFSYIPRWPPITNTFPVIITVHQQSFVLFRPGPRVSHFIPTWTVEADKKMNLKV